MTDKITEIRARHERIQRDGILSTPPGSMAGQVAAVDAHEDRATLLAEVERQRAEIERLRAQMQEIRERLYLAAGHAAAAALLSEEAHRKALESKP